jgi:hypothetical protein
MHGIKFFFSIKIIRQFRGGKKNFQGVRAENITENHYFLKSRGARAPPRILLGPPLFIITHILPFKKKKNTQVCSYITFTMVIICNYLRYITFIMSIFNYPYLSQESQQRETYAPYNYLCQSQHFIYLQVAKLFYSYDMIIFLPIVHWPI